MNASAGLSGGGVLLCLSIEKTSDLQKDRSGGGEKAFFSKKSPHKIEQKSVTKEYKICKKDIAILKRCVYTLNDRNKEL